MSDHTDIPALIADYFAGLYDGDTAKLRGVFHPFATLFGEVRGKPYRKSVDDYLSVVAGRTPPRALGEPFRMQLLYVEHCGEIAVAKVRVPILGHDYRDYLTLVREDGRWSIVSKVFTHIPE